MPYDVRQWPESVYPKEVEDECPEALADIDTFIMQMRANGPAPDGYKVKPLGKTKGGLWQLNLKVDGRQIRILYAPYGQTIILFRIHKKSSPQEQERAYRLAMSRKRDFETPPKQESKKKTNEGITLH
jgi:hypothetical protein